MENRSSKINVRFQRQMQTENVNNVSINSNTKRNGVWTRSGSKMPSQEILPNLGISIQTHL